MGKPKNFENSQNSWLSGWRGSIEEKVTCPYSPNHVMPYRRLVLHIIQCAQKNAALEAQWMTCPYSSLHRFPTNELASHLQVCREHEMSLHTRIAAGKSPCVEVFASCGAPKAQQLPCDTLDENDPKVVELMNEWNDML